MLLMQKETVFLFAFFVNYMYMHSVLFDRPLLIQVALRGRTGSQSVTQDPAGLNVWQ